jgi:adenosine 3'-phospho 5'-phosphosulfate transporter B3
MLLSKFLPGLKRTYTLQDYVSALALVLGLIVFTLADAASSPKFHVFGVAMVCTALVLDSFMNNFTEVVFTTVPETSQVRRLFGGHASGEEESSLPLAIFRDQSHPDFTSCSFFYGVLLPRLS